MAKGTKYSQEFKEDAVRYRLEHPEMALRKCAENLGISESALKNWMKSVGYIYYIRVICHSRLCIAGNILIIFNVNCFIF